MDNCFDMQCPKCGRSDEIDIAATVWVRLTHDGTDSDESRDGSHEWDNDSQAVCHSCGHAGTVSSFSDSEGEATTEKKAGVYGCPHCKSTEGFRENNVLHAYADVNCFDSQGEPEYGGNSDVDWNSQRIDDADPEPYTCVSCKNDFAEPEWIREVEEE